MLAAFSRFFTGVSTSLSSVSMSLRSVVCPDVGKLVVLFRKGIISSARSVRRRHGHQTRAFPICGQWSNRFSCDSGDYGGFVACKAVCYPLVNNTADQSGTRVW